MKIPISWLKEHLPTKLSSEQIADTLTSLGLEVEGIEEEILEIALTPNLAHCASVRGVARELAAFTQERLESPKYTLVETSGSPIETVTSVRVENTEACPRYACRLLEGVTVTDSPDWLKNRVEQCGIRSVNNVVDTTNLVLMELGQPLHAFDFDKLDEKRIVVRNARKGESLVTLDEKEHFPTENTLLICDGKGPVAIAGVMGSKESEVGSTTTRVLLEGAYFEPSQVRRTSKRMGIQTEASYRFERGTDPNGVIEALERATAWICEIAGGTAHQGVIDLREEEGTPFVEKRVKCRLDRVNKLLGTQLAMSEVETIFRRLGLETSAQKQETIEVVIPTYRHDISHEIDLVEEVARLYGIDNLHKREVAPFRTGELSHSPLYLFEKRMRTHLIAQGLQEFLTCNLISPDEAALIAHDSMPARALIKLLNPSSQDQSILRTSLLPGMLKVVKHNRDHESPAIAGFEIGRVHFKTKKSYLEPTVASIVLSGPRSPLQWGEKERECDFYDLKGIVENFLASLNLERVTFVPSRYENFHPGRQSAIMMGKLEIGTLGEVHPNTLRKVGIDAPVLFAELNLEDLMGKRQGEIKMVPLAQFPASSRDWTVTLSEQFPVGTLVDWIIEMQTPLLESVTILDIYRSDKLGKDKKNVSLRFVYRDREKTLSIKAIEEEHQRITSTLTERI